jgi:hypothetical protein
MKFGQFFSENGPLFIWKGGILKINFQKNFGKLEIFILKQYTMGKFIITESEKNNILNLYGRLNESEEMELIQNELENNGVSVPVGEIVDPTEPLCTAPQTGNPEEDNVLSKVWEWAQSQSVESLQDMKSKIKDSISKAKELLKGKRVDEQVAPLLVIGGVSITASLLIAVGALLLFIIIVAIIIKRSRNSSPCKRRRKLVKRFGMDGNFM